MAKTDSPPFDFPLSNSLPAAVAEERYAQTLAGQALSRTDHSVSWKANIKVDSQNDGSTKGIPSHGGYSVADARLDFDLIIDTDAWADLSFQSLKTLPLPGWPVLVEAEVHLLAGDTVWRSITHGSRNWGQTSSASVFLTPGVYRIKARLYGEATPTYFLGGSFGADVGVEYSLVLRPVPEPSAALLAGLGFGGFALFALRRCLWRQPSVGFSQIRSAEP